MARALACLPILLALQAQAQVAVTDPALTAAVQVSNQMNQLHQKFMRMQMVQDAVVLKNTYLQSKQYYEMVERRSKHRGGLMGYYRDFFDQQMQNVAADEWRKLNFEASSITGDTPLSRLVRQGADALGNGAGEAFGAAGGRVGKSMDGVDAGYKGARAVIFREQASEVASADKLSLASEDRAAKIGAMIGDLVKRGSASSINDHERESIEMHAQLLQLQLLSEMRQLLNLNAQINNAKAKRSLAEAAAAIRAAQDLGRFRAAAAKAPRATDDQVVHELRRRPGER